MPDIILIFTCIISVFIVGLELLWNDFQSHKPLYYLVIPLILTVWFGIAFLQPKVVDKVYTSPIIQQNDTQYVIFELPDGTRVINLCKKNGKILPEGTKVQLTTYKHWYFGIYFNKGLLPTDLKILQKTP